MFAQPSTVAVYAFFISRKSSSNQGSLPQVFLFASAVVPILGVFMSSAVLWYSSTNLLLIVTTSFLLVQFDCTISLDSFVISLLFCAPRNFIGSPLLFQGYRFGTLSNLLRDFLLRCSDEC